MEKDIFELIESKIQTLDSVPGVNFEEEKVWRKITRELPGQSYGKFRRFIWAMGILLAFIIAYLSIQNLFSDMQNPQYQIQEEIRTVPSIRQASKPTKPDKSFLINSNIKDSIPESTINTKATKIVNDTIKIDRLPNQPIKKDIEFNQARLENKEPAIMGIVKIPQKPVVHIYRPSRYVGSGLVFKLKTNGNLIQKIRNGKHYVVQLNAGLTQFRVGKKTLYVNLKSGEKYYLKVPSEGFPIGRPGLELVLEEVAAKEIKSL